MSNITTPQPKLIPIYKPVPPTPDLPEISLAQPEDQQSSVHFKSKQAAPKRSILGLFCCVCVDIDGCCCCV